jgi:hypothetical protein
MQNQWPIFKFGVAELGQHPARRFAYRVGGYRL